MAKPKKQREVGVSTEVSDPAWLLYLEGLGHNMDRSFAKAIKKLEKANQLNPNQPVVWRELGAAYSGLGNKAEAAEAYAKSFNQDPTQDAVWLKLVETNAAAGNFEQAEKAIRYGVKHFAKSMWLPYAYSYLGTVYAHALKQKEAEKILSKLRKLDSSLADDLAQTIKEKCGNK